MSTRATPFGLFAGVAMGRIDACTDLRIGGPDQMNRRTRLDGDYLDRLADALNRQREVRAGQGRVRRCVRGAGGVGRGTAPLHYNGYDIPMEESRERFEKVEGQISGLREESQEGIRHTHILIEDVRGIVRLLAEGMAGLDERMGRLEGDLNRKLKELWDMVVTPVRSLGERVTHLEEVENRRARDIVDVIRERYGLPRES